MAVSKRYRRRIVVEGQDFYWTLAPNREWYYEHPVAKEGDFVLTVVPSDKSFRLYWAVDAARRHPDEGLHPLVLRKSDRIPLDERIDVPGQVTPGLVAELVRAALTALAS